MRKVLCVEPVIFVYIFAFSLTTPLVQQFIYRRLWEQEYNSTFVSNNVSHCEQNQSSPAYIKQKASGGGGIITVNKLAASRCSFGKTSCFITLSFNSPESHSSVTCSHFTVSSCYAVGSDRASKTKIYLQEDTETNSYFSGS